MILEYADPKDTIRELKKALLWCKVRAAVYLVLVASVAAVLAYHEGYRRGCENTVNVVEQKINNIASRLGFN